MVTTRTQYIVKSFTFNIGMNIDITIDITIVIFLSYCYNQLLVVLPNLHETFLKMTNLNFV